MKAEEIAAFEKKFGYKPTGIRVALDALAVFVSKDNPIQSLTLAQVDAIFSLTRKGGAPADITTWGQVGRPASGRAGRSVDAATAHRVRTGTSRSTSAEGRLQEHGQGAAGARLRSCRASRRPRRHRLQRHRPPHGGVRAVPIVGKERPGAGQGRERLQRQALRHLPPRFVYVNKAPGQPLPLVIKEFLTYVVSKDGPGDHGEGGIRAAAGDSRGQERAEAQLVGGRASGSGGCLGPRPPLAAPAAGGAAPAGSSRVTRRVRPRVNGSTMSPHAAADRTVVPARDHGSARPRRAPRRAPWPRSFDALAGGVVRVGGIMVILAVIGILVFLVATVLPLFRAAQVVERPVAGKVPVEGHLHLLAVDEYRQLRARSASPRRSSSSPGHGRSAPAHRDAPTRRTARVACAHRADPLQRHGGRDHRLRLAFLHRLLLRLRARQGSAGAAQGHDSRPGSDRRPRGRARRGTCSASAPTSRSAATSHFPRARVRSSVPPTPRRTGRGPRSRSLPRTLSIWSERRRTRGVGEGSAGAIAWPRSPRPDRQSPSDGFEALVDEEARVGWLVEPSSGSTCSRARRIRARRSTPGVTAAELLIGGRSLLSVTPGAG